MGLGLESNFVVTRKADTKLTTPESAINNHRREVDRIDLLITELLNKRAMVVENIARVKLAGHQLFCNVSELQNEVLDNLERHNAGPLTQDALRSIFEQIMEEMLKHEQTVVGHPGSPSSV